jgi:hypothetical protein
LDTKKLLLNCTSKHANVCYPVNVILREKGALLYKPALYIEEFWRNSPIGSVPILISIDDLDRIIDIGRHTLDQRNLLLNRECICPCQRCGIVRSSLDAVDGTPTGFDPDEVVSKIVKLLLDSSLSGVADGHDTDDCRDADRYS